MIVVWDEPKRLANIAKHGLDFADFESGFSWDAFAVIPARPSRVTGRMRRNLLDCSAMASSLRLCLRSDRKPYP